MTEGRARARSGGGAVWRSDLARGGGRTEGEEGCVAPVAGEGKWGSAKEGTSSGEGWVALGSAFLSGIHIQPSVCFPHSFTLLSYTSTQPSPLLHAVGERVCSPTALLHHSLPPPPVAVVCLKSLLLSAFALASVGSAALQKTSRRAVDVRRADAVAAKRSVGHQHRRRSFELISGVESVTTYVSGIATEVNTELAADVPAVATIETLLGNVVSKVSGWVLAARQDSD